jgi:hypothetical protein
MSLPVQIGHSTTVVIHVIAWLDRAQHNRGDPRHCLSRQGTAQQQERHQVKTLMGLVHRGDPCHCLSRQGGCNKKSIRPDLSRLSLRAGSRDCHPLQSKEQLDPDPDRGIKKIVSFLEH